MITKRLIPPFYLIMIATIIKMMMVEAPEMVAGSTLRAIHQYHIIGLDHFDDADDELEKRSATGAAAIIICYTFIFIIINNKN